ncbi:protein kinase domain-containing protein [Ferrimonas pelagia]|uniref:Protein kinase domain-containing protein n=1 Tax=Ferrimonas pelagia TaxID=1177826 RepID=A0ABP9EPZ5_9GAMM
MSSQHQNGDIKALFEQAMAMAPGARQQWLSTLPTEIAQELSELLASTETGAAFFSELSEGLFGGGGASDDDPLELIGSQVGDFYVTALLGAGGMGVVYKAFDAKLERDVALKFLAPGQYLSESARDRFSKESKLASKLEHAHIGTVYGLIEGPHGQDVMVMAYYEGQTLDQLFSHDTPVPEQLLQWMQQCMSALAYAHSQGVVHRDIKPGNLMLLPDGDLRILDFGAATLVEDGSEQTGIPIGTTRYMSPEQIRCERVSGESDYWSLGVVLLEACEKLGWIEEVNAFVWAQNPAVARSRIPAQFETILMALLTVEPDKRCKAVRALSQGTGAVFSPQTRLQRRWRTFALLGLALVIIGWGFSQQATSDYVLPSHQKLSLLLAPQGIELERVLAEELENALELIAAKESNVSYLGVAEQANTAYGANLLLQLSLSALEEGTFIAELSLIDKSNAKVVRHWSDRYPQDRLDLIVKDLSHFMGEALQITPSVNGLLSDRDRVSSPDAYRRYLSAAANVLEFEDDPVLANEGLLDQAEQALLAVNERNPSATFMVLLAKINRLRANAFNQDRYMIQADLWANRALQQNPNYVYSYIESAAISRLQGRLGSAIAAYKLALSILPSHEGVLIELADTYRAAGQSELAEQSIRRVLENPRRVWRTSNEIAKYYYRAGDYVAAKHHFQDALSFGEQNPIVLSNIGSVHFKLHEMDKALYYYREVLKFEQSYATLASLATASFYVGDYEAALKYYQAAIELNPGHYTAWATLGLVQSILFDDSRYVKSIERAVDLASELLQVYPQSGQLMAQIAVYNQMLHRDSEAAYYYQQVLLQSDINAMTAFSVAEYLERIGERKQAVDWLNRSKQKGLNSELIHSYPVFSALISDTLYQQQRLF